VRPKPTPRQRVGLAANADGVIYLYCTEHAEDARSRFPQIETAATRPAAAASQPSALAASSAAGATVTASAMTVVTAAAANVTAAGVSVAVDEKAAVDAVIGEKATVEVAAAAISASVAAATAFPASAAAVEAKATEEQVDASEAEASSPRLTPRDRAAVAAQASAPSEIVVPAGLGTEADRALEQEIIMRAKLATSPGAPGVVDPNPLARCLQCLTLPT
jgi:hypothetical protein